MVSSSSGKEGLDAIRMPVGTGIAGQCALTGRNVNIPNAYHDTRFSQENDRRTGYKTVSLLCCPIFFDAEVIAVIQLVNKRNGECFVPFEEEDECLFSVFSSFAGVVLANAYHQHNALIESRRSDAFIEAARRICLIDAQNPLFTGSVICEVTKELVNAASCTFVEVNNGDGATAYSSETGNLSKGFSGRGIAEHVIQTKVLENISQPYSHAAFNPDYDLKTSNVTNSILCVPVMSVEEDGDQKVLGVVEAVNSKHNSFRKRDEDSLTGLAQFVALHLRNANLCKFLKESQKSALHLLELQSHVGLHQMQTKELTVTHDQVNEAMAIELTSEEKEVVLTDVFNVHDYFQPPKRARLIPLCVHLFDHLDFLIKFNVSRTKFFRFLLTVARKYRAVPYHNFVHAFDVTHTVFTYLSQLNMMQELSPLDAFSLLIACLVHDIDHMGLNNAFHTKVETPLGLLSNASGTTSVLEVHHCNLALEILGIKETSIFDGMTDEDSHTAYKNIVRIVLATDMAGHKGLVEDFTSTCGEGYDKKNKIHRQSLLKILMKCGDLSNITKPFKISRLWAVAVTDEFYEQGDKEKELGCGITPNFDRNNKPELAETQIGFITFVGIPFFAAASAVFQSMECLVTQMKSNREQWEKVLASRQAPQKSVF